MKTKNCYPEKMGICKVITKENALLHHATFIKLTGYTTIACPNITNTIAKPLRISISLYRRIFYICMISFILFSSPS